MKLRTTDLTGQRSTEVELLHYSVAMVYYGSSPLMSTLILHFHGCTACFSALTVWLFFFFVQLILFSSYSNKCLYSQVLTEIKLESIESWSRSSLWLLQKINMQYAYLHANIDLCAKKHFSMDTRWLTLVLNSIHDRRKGAVMFLLQLASVITVYLLSWLSCRCRVWLDSNTPGLFYVAASVQIYFWCLKNELTVGNFSNSGSKKITPSAWSLMPFGS